MSSDAKHPHQLSPWWRHSVIIVLVIGFSILIWLAIRTYDTAPPIPKKVLTFSGATVYTGEEIIDGQQIFLKYGLMENGTIWGHGAYLGPDFSAEYLHTLVLRGSELLAQQKYNRSFSGLAPDEQATILGELRKDLRDNRYDERTGTLTLSDEEVASFHEQVGNWGRYFSEPTKNAGLPARYISAEI